MPVPNLRALAQRLESTFPGRCAGSFMAMQGLDRAMVIASQAFTALIPLLILVSALSPTDNRDIVSDAIISRFELGGSAASAVEQVFARPDAGSTGVLSVVLLLFSGISLARRMQRMYLIAWRLEPVAGPRGSLNAAFGLGALLLEIALLYMMHSLVRELPFEWVLGGPIAAGASLLLWTSVPWLLLDRRVHWRRLLPGGALAALCASLYGIATTIYMPGLMERYSAQYGLFGVTLALVGWLLSISFIVVTATVVAAEFDRAPERWARRLRSRLVIEPTSSTEAMVDSSSVPTEPVPDEDQPHRGGQ